MQQESPFDATESARGCAAAVGAFLCWGLIAPVYFKLVGAAGPAEIMAHRIIWTVAALTAILLIFRSPAALKAAVDSRRKLGVFALTTFLITVNWSFFVWAVAESRLVETSLGYFINPLVNVGLGVVFLKEKLNRWQVVAVLVATAGVASLVAALGSFPWLPLTLAFSFGFYALVRKMEGVDPLIGLLVETALPAPIALGYLLWLGPQGHFGGADGSISWLLPLAGPMTALPLGLFLYAGRRLKLSTIGLLQYIGPTGQLLLGVAVYGETFSSAHAAAFGCVWLALVVYTADAWARSRRAAAYVHS